MCMCLCVCVCRKFNGVIRFRSTLGEMPCVCVCVSVESLML